jgi:hypothetical protein
MANKKVLAIKLLISAVESTPQLTTCQVLSTILRSRGKGTPPYEWTDDRLVDEIRGYIASLSENPLDPIEKDY